MSRIRKALEKAMEMCTHSWSTRPEKGGIPGGHYEHKCGLEPKHRGKHVCRTWDCSETD